MAQKVIIVGASSGIGYELAKVYSENGFEVGITARRLENLKQLQQELPGKSYVRQMDVTRYEEARNVLEDLVQEMGGLDILVLNAGIGFSKPSWENEIRIIEVNAAGFTALANWAVAYFEEKGGGQIAGISSMASLMGTRIATVYSATKAYVSSYMQGIRSRSYYKKQGLVVTDIKAGFIATNLTAGNKGMFWVATPQKAARQIFEAVKKKKRVAYITRRWRIIAWIIKLTPDFLMERA